MALLISVYVLDKGGSEITHSGLLKSSDTIATLLNDSNLIAAGITEVSATIGGEALSHDSVINHVLSLHPDYTETFVCYKYIEKTYPETIAGQIERLQDAKAAIKTSIESKGVTVPSSAKLDGYDDYISAIEQTGYDGPYAEFNTNRRGPAPSGFHVPSGTEWEGVKTIMDSLNLTTGADWRIKLHMPFAGYRSLQTAAISYQGTEGRYRSVSPITKYSSCYLYLDTSKVVAKNYYDVSEGHSIRCFKDSYETPTSSWNVIQGTLGSAGIFWNRLEGLISITGDGTTGYTIADKNLGATTVYNNGNTLTQANMGNIYQWGNNYGFPSTGSVTTSSTQVNVSYYGPTKPNGYYSNSTFIINNSNWATSPNFDLWGGYLGTEKNDFILIDGIKYYSKPLLSYEQILAYKGTGIAKLTGLISILNSAPIEHFNKMLSEGHLLANEYYANNNYGIKGSSGYGDIQTFGKTLDRWLSTFVCCDKNSGIRYLNGTDEPV